MLIDIEKGRRIDCESNNNQQMIGATLHELRQKHSNSELISIPRLFARTLLFTRISELDAARCSM
jgi:hypothetical protein